MQTHPARNSNSFLRSYILHAAWILPTSAYTVLQGSYAKVKYAQHVDTGEAVAVKVGPLFNLPA